MPKVWLDLLLDFVAWLVGAAVVGIGLGYLGDRLMARLCLGSDAEERIRLSRPMPRRSK